MSATKKGKLAQWTSEEGLAKLEELAAVHTDTELISEMHIASSTFYRWLKREDISAAIDKGRNGAIAAAAVKEVEASLLERCVGGVHEVAKAVKIKTVEYDEATGRRLRETERVELAMEQVYVPADTAAIKFFLTNRAPERWKNRTELSTDDDTKQTLEELLAGMDGGREF